MYFAGSPHGNKSSSTIVTSWIRALALPIAPALLLGAVSAPARAEGLSAYLPLNLEPEIERQIERVLILADEPLLKRPIPVELVKLALPEACKIDKPLCHKVERYLERYSRDYALTHASITGSATHDKDAGVVPNEYGLPITSHWDLSAQGFVQPTDYLLAQAGVDAYSGRTQPVGSELGVGFSWAQLDIGYRDHWFSPMTDSSMLMSTESPTTPSATLSNYEPLTRLGISVRILHHAPRSDREGEPPGQQHSLQRCRQPGRSPPVRRAIVDRALSRLVDRRQPHHGVWRG